MTARKVSITGTPPATLVEVDGKLVHPRALTLAMDVRSVPQLTLELAITEADVETEAMVIIPEHTAKTLIALGWTPPERED
jgi:hypothetical protein